MDSIYDILHRLDAISEDIGPEQRAVKQLPALFKPPQTSPQISGPYPGQNATRGYLVGEGAEDDVTPMTMAVIARIVHTRPKWITTYGAAAVEQAIEDLVGDNDYPEIDPNDVSVYVKAIGEYLRDHRVSREDMDESKEPATEDVLSDVKKKLGDYLQDVATAIKTDPDLKDKIPQTIDQVKAVKTIRTDDGKEIKILGNEDDGFRISIKNKEIETPFKNLDEAVMACEMYCARRRMVETTADYVEEKRS